MGEQPNAGRNDRLSREIAKIKGGDAKESLKDILEFNMTPRQFKENILDKFVIGQEEGKKTISTGVCYHFKNLALLFQEQLFNNNKTFEDLVNDPKVEIPKKNAMIVGPTGCGKSYTFKVISQNIKVPVLEVSLPDYSGAGYVGENISDIPFKMLSRAAGDIYRAQIGIIFLDEIDKVAIPRGGYGPLVNTQQVQEGLLKFVEGAWFDFPKYIQPPKDVKGGEIKGLSTKFNYIASSGAFAGTKYMSNLQKIVEKRAEEQKLEGYENWAEVLLTEDFIEYGMLPQLMGRFPIHAVYFPLNENDLYRIMTESEGSPAKQSIEELQKLWGIKVEITDEAYRLIAQRSAREKTGARGCITALNKVLLNIQYNLPGRTDVEPIKIDTDYVKEQLKWRN